MKVYLDSIPAIDTHDHLWPFEKLPGYEMTENGSGDESRRPAQQLPHTGEASHAVDGGGSSRTGGPRRNTTLTTWRSVTFYRYQAVALKDLYGVDFDAITDDQAAELDRRIFRNYLTKDWLFEVVTQKANIELDV